eukprot:301877-Chlamydomonas_euryale.AAC.1
MKPNAKSVTTALRKCGAVLRGSGMCCWHGARDIRGHWVWSGVEGVAWATSGVEWFGRCGIGHIRWGVVQKVWHGHIRWGVVWKVWHAPHQVWSATEGVAWATSGVERYGRCGMGHMSIAS